MRRLPKLRLWHALTLWAFLISAGIYIEAQQPQTETAPIYAVNAKYANGVAPGYWTQRGAGLVLNVGPGTVNCAATIRTYAGGTLTLANNTTNYVFLDTTTLCTPSSNTSGFTSATIPLAIVVTSGGAITSRSDARTTMSTAVGTGTIVGGTCTNQVITALTTSGTPTCTTVTSAYVNNTIALTGADINTSSVVTKVNAGAIPVSANYLRTNGSGQFIAGDFPEVKDVPAANCPNAVAGSGWSYATSTFTSACRAGTNNLGGALQAIPATGAVGQFNVELPQDWDTASQPFINIYYGSGANTSGTVIWTISTACQDVSTPGGATDDPSFHAESAFATQTMAAANRSWYVGGQLTAATSGNGCKALSPIIYKLTLSGTAASNINVYKAVITNPRSPVVQAN